MEQKKKSVSSKIFKLVSTEETHLITILIAGALVLPIILVFFLAGHENPKLPPHPSSSKILGDSTQKNNTPPYPQLTEINPFSKNNLNKKEAIKGLTSVEPVTIAHTVKEGDSVHTIALKYKADAQTIVDYPNNNIPDDLSLVVGSVIIIPAGVIGNEKIKDILPIGNGYLSWPIKGIITQYAFAWHLGAVDIDLDIGEPIRAAKEGTVLETMIMTTGYGQHVIVDHGEGYKAIYAHLSEIKVVPGQKLNRGEVLGLGGSTGRSTGPHLHFEVHKNNTPIDPLSLFDSGQIVK